MLATPKKLLHKCFRAFGFDIRAVRNLNAALAELDKERQQRYLAWLGELRSTGARWASTAPARPVADDVVSTVWGDADELFRAACSRMRAAHTVLDIGCGIRPQPFVDAAIHICCEPCEDYMHRLMVESSHEPKYVYLACDLARATGMFPPGSVDSVFLVDVLEHIDKEAALKSLRNVVCMARSQVMVFTPVGFMPQQVALDGHDPWGMAGGAWQEHRSSWQPEDFPAKDGWEVIACKDFHRTDAYGKPLEHPIGAMWAIWTAPQVDEEANP